MTLTLSKITVCPDVIVVWAVSLALKNTSFLSTSVPVKCLRQGPEIIKLFSCSTQLTIKFELLKNSKIAKYVEIEGLELQSL